MKQPSKIYFLVGMSRGGTTWMMKSLNRHPEIAAFGETLFWGRNYFAPDTGNYYSREQLAKLAVYYSNFNIKPTGEGEGALNPETIACFRNRVKNEVPLMENCTPKFLFEYLCSLVSKSENKQIAIEKTPHHVNWLDRIMENFASTKVIAMVRDPYDFVLSYKFQGSQPNSSSRNVFRKLYHPAVAAIIWRGYARSLRRYKEKYRERLFTVHTEDLGDDNRLLFSRLFQFLNVEDISDGFVPVDKDNSSFEAIDKPTLTAADYFWLHLIAKNEIERSVYQLRSYDFELLEVIRSIFFLPFWGARAALILNKQFAGSSLRYIFNWIR